MILFFHDSLPFVTSSMPLTSQGLVLATAMAVSAGTVFLIELFRDKNFTSSPITQNQEDDSPPDSKKFLKSCLCSGSKKKEKDEKKKKKRVQFAEDVKDSTGNGELYRKQQQRIKPVEIQSSSCGNEIGKGLGKIPENRMALYSGILKNRVQRMEYSH